MAFTRFSNDNARQKKKIEESVFSGIYHLNTPGNGINNNYIDDVNIRLQKWGANLHSNTCNLESNMKGLNIPLNRGTIESKKTITNSKRQELRWANCWICPFSRPTIRLALEILTRTFLRRTNNRNMTHPMA